VSREDIEILSGLDPIAVDRAPAPLDPEAHAAMNEGGERRS
jgi:hypothetical protein